MRRSLAAEGFPIAEARQIRALSSPIRQDIVDAVTAIGPCSVAELSATIGKPADGLYYHVRRLLRVGLLKEVAANDTGRGELRLDAGRRASYLEYQPGSRANKAAVLRVVGGMVRSAERSFQRGFHPDVAVVKGLQRNLWAGRARGALTQRELAEVNTLLDRLNTLMQSGRRDNDGIDSPERSLFELTFILAPSARGAKRK